MSKIPRPVITQEIAQAALQYEPDTGLFKWRERSDRPRHWNTRYAGKVAGCRITLGIGDYISVNFLNYPILAHRLAFIWMTGSVPDIIDHADGDGTNNAWCNLRSATRMQNGANSKLSKKNTSGFKGVSFCKNSEKWRAYVYCSGKQIALGLFVTAEDAHAAYLKKASELFGYYARAR